MTMIQALIDDIWKAAATPETLSIGIAVLAAVAVISGIYALASVNLRARGRRKDRLQRAIKRRAKALTQSAHSAILSTADEGGFEDLVARLLPRPEKLRARLAMTGRKITLGTYAAANGICFFVGALALWRAMGLSPAVSLLGGAALGVLIPHLYISYLIAKRRDKFIDALADGVDVMVRGLRAGLPVSETVIAVVQESKPPVKDIFADVADRVRVGAEVDQAFAKAAEKIAAPELKFLSITLSVQKETGGNLAETLENLSEILRKRRQMKLKIKAVSSEARASAMILGSLPFVMFGLIFLINRPYALELFMDPRGHVMLGVGLGAMALGIGVMAKMIKFEI